MLTRSPPCLWGSSLDIRQAVGEFLAHVLEGEFAFYIGRSDGTVSRTAVRAGQVMPLAGGTSHTIRNESTADAVGFVVHSPGRAMEGFTRAAAALATQGAPSMDAVLAIAEQHGIELLGPIPEGSGGDAGPTADRPAADSMDVDVRQASLDL